MKIYTFDEHQIVNFANDVKDAIAKQMGLPQLNDVVVIVAQRGWFDNFLRRLVGNAPEEDEHCIMIMKPI